MRKTIAFTLFAACLVMAGCDGDTPVSADRTRPSALLAPEDGGGGGGGGGESGGGTYTPPPAPQFRMVPALARNNSGDYVASTTFEQYANGSWQRYDTSNVAVACYVTPLGYVPGGSGTSLRDSETEYNASKVTITFDLPSDSYYVDCYHSANSGAYTAVTRNYTNYIN